MIVTLPRRSADELRFLRANGRLAAASGGPGHRHLQSPVSLLNYLRIADEVAALSGPGTLLDWGCGYGQMSYLLVRRGLDVLAYDVGKSFEDLRLPMTRGLAAVRGDHPSTLPFDDETFGTVLSCGVLEHVPDEDASLREIRRVLAPGGKLLIYNLPQKCSYKELVIRRFAPDRAHDRRYSQGSIEAALHRNDFRVLRIRRAGALPHLGTGIPRPLFRIYETLPRAVIAADRALSRMPLLAHVAQSLEIVAEIPRLVSDRDAG